jgi:hypothetical protein
VKNGGVPSQSKTQAGDTGLTITATFSSAALLCRLGNAANIASKRLRLLRRDLQRCLVFRLVVIFHQAEAPTD